MLAGDPALDERAAHIVQPLGYRDVHALDGGASGWARSGRRGRAAGLNHYGGAVVLAPRDNPEAGADLLELVFFPVGEPASTLSTNRDDSRRRQRSMRRILLIPADVTLVRVKPERHPNLKAQAALSVIARSAPGLPARAPSAPRDGLDDQASGFLTARRVGRSRCRLLSPPQSRQRRNLSCLERAQPLLASVTTMAAAMVAVSIVHVGSLLFLPMRWHPLVRTADQKVGAVVCFGKVYSRCSNR